MPANLLDPDSERIREIIGLPESLLELKIFGLIDNVTDFQIQHNGADIFHVDTAGNLTTIGYTDIAEIPTPAAPSDNIGRLYTRDNATNTGLFFKNSTQTEFNLLDKSLNDLTDVTLGSQATNQILIATSTSLFENKTMSGDATLAASGALTIANDAVTYAKIQNVVSNNVLLGNITGADSIVAELTVAQVTALLDTFTATLKGLVPVSGGSATEFLSADGTFSTPIDTAGVTSINTDTTSNQIIAAGTGLVIDNSTNTHTLSIDSTVATLTGSQNITNKTFLGTNPNEFQDNALIIQNPANTFNYLFQTSAIITADKTVTLPLLLTSDTFVFENYIQTLTNKTFTAPKFADLGFIADASGNEILVFDTVTSAVNFAQLANAATGNNISLSVLGADTNIGLDIIPKGTGLVTVDNFVGTGTKRIEYEIISATFTSSYELDLQENDQETITLTGNITFTTSNRASGRTKTIRIITDGTLRTFTFPAWVFVGAKPTDQAASKTGVLTLTAYGTADIDIVAAYAVEA